MSSLLFSYAIFKVLWFLYCTVSLALQRSLIHQISCSLRRKIWEFVAADLPAVFQKKTSEKWG